jgi:hypothetical protein
MMDKREGAGALEPHLVDLLGQVQMGLGAAVRKGTVSHGWGRVSGCGQEHVTLELCHEIL